MLSDMNFLSLPSAHIRAGPPRRARESQALPCTSDKNQRVGPRTEDLVRGGGRAPRRRAYHCTGSAGGHANSRFAKMAGFSRALEATWLLARNAEFRLPPSPLPKPPPYPAPSTPQSKSVRQLASPAVGT